VQVIAYRPTRALDGTLHRLERTVHGVVEIAREVIRERLEQRFDTGEVVVERAARDTRARADVLDARCAAVFLTEELECGVQQRDTGAQPALGADLRATRVIDATTRTAADAWPL
jgi:hypothetical protein